MWIRKPIHVTISSIVQESGSMRNAKSTAKSAIALPACPSPAGTHVKYLCTNASCTSPRVYVKTTHDAMSAERPVVASAKKFVIARFFGVSGFANAREPLTSAPNAGSSTISSSALAIQRPRFIDIDRAAQPVQLNDDGQPHRRLPCRDGDDEDREDLPFERREPVREGDEVDVD